MQPNPNEDILVDAIIDQTKKLEEISSSSDVQVDGIVKTNNSLQDLNDTAELILEGMMKKEEPKSTRIEVEIDGANMVTYKGEKGDKGDEPTDERLIGLIVPLIPEVKDGKDGVDGVNPDANEVAMEVLKMVLPEVPTVEEIVAQIPVPKNGRDGKDAENISIEEILASIPTPKNGRDGSPDTGEEIVSKLKELPKGKKLSIDDLDDLPDFQSLKRQSSKTVSLVELDDVDLSGVTKTNGKYVLGGGAGAVSSVNGETGAVVLDTSDIADTTDKRYVTDTDLTNLAGVTSNIQTQLDIVPITNERLTTQTFPNAIAGNIGSGDVDIYTCPTDKRAIVNMVTLLNTAGTTTTYSMRLKVSGVYYRISTNGTITAGGNTSLQSYSLILEAGESLAINTSQAGLNVFPTIIEFSNTAKSRTVKNLSIVSGDNTIYTVPSGKTAILLSAPTIRAGTGAIQYVNTSGSTATYSMHISSSTSSASTNRFASTTLATNTAGIQSIGTMIPSTYSIVLNTNQTGGIAYVSVIEV